jgi:hypothetical protein
VSNLKYFVTLPNPCHLTPALVYQLSFPEMGLWMQAISSASTFSQIFPAKARTNNNTAVTATVNTILRRF